MVSWSFEFLKYFNLFDYGRSLAAFPSISKLQLQNIPVTYKIVKVITTLDFWDNGLKLGGASEELRSELTCILPYLFNICLSETSFLDFSKVLSDLPLLSLRLFGIYLPLKTTTA